jgi:hypothetical protein
VKAAGLPAIRTLDTSDFAARPSVNEALVRELIGGACIEGREKVLVVGNTGTGKTHLASAACARRRLARSFTVTRLVTRLPEQAPSALAFRRRIGSGQGGPAMLSCDRREVHMRGQIITPAPG